ncbi:hypothetical protein [Streptomyces sp. NPDC052496]|uniref:hypothetical protein n=1 Tax=Streptomyces sp. NPDC052496 TaxID=3154951 RepID=UPI00341D1ECA
MNQERATAMVDRLLAIDWRDEEAEFEHSASRARLLREYLRRTALWVQELQKGDDRPFFDVSQSDRWPFFDLAKRVDPSVRADEGLSQRLDDFIDEHVPGALAARLCRAALNWASISRDSLGKLPELPDPFEPLVVLFERGGGFWVENGFVDFVAYRVRLATWQEHLAAAPLTSLDPASLDALDAD